MKARRRDVETLKGSLLLMAGALQKLAEACPPAYRTARPGGVRTLSGALLLAAGALQKLAEACPPELPSRLEQPGLPAAKRGGPCVPRVSPGRAGAVGKSGRSL